MKRVASELDALEGADISKTYAGLRQNLMHWKRVAQ
jgi:hypothetical protein